MSYRSNIYHLSWCPTGLISIICPDVLLVYCLVYHLSWCPTGLISIICPGVLPVQYFSSVLMSYRSNIYHLSWCPTGLISIIYPGVLLVYCLVYHLLYHLFRYPQSVPRAFCPAVTNVLSIAFLILPPISLSSACACGLFSVSSVLLSSALSVTISSELAAPQRQAKMS